MTRLAARLTLATLAGCALAGILIGGYWMAALATFLAICAVTLPPRASGSWWGWAGSAVGLLGGGVGITSALLAIAERGTAASYETRIGFAVAALVLAAAAQAGGALVITRPRAAIGLLLAGSTAGCLAMALFTVDTWYFVALPLCWFAAAIAVVRSVASAGTSRGAA